MLISNHRTRERFADIKIKVNKQIITEKENIKILGVTISNDLSWEQHLTSQIGNLGHRFRSFSRACSMLTMDTKKLLYNSSIASRLGYCDIIWDKCNQSSIKKLQTLQNRCARRMLGCQPGTTAFPLIRKLGWLTLNEKRMLHKCVLLHSLLQGRGPQILIDDLGPWTSRHTRATRGTASENLSVIAHNTNYVAKSFYYDTAKIWNTLPVHIRQIENRSTFKENLHKYFLIQTR